MRAGGLLWVLIALLVVYLWQMVAPIVGPWLQSATGVL